MIGMEGCVWTAPPDQLGLREGDVHVWKSRLDIAPHHVCALVELLSEDEVERAQRFRFLRDRRRFIVARGKLRLILGRYAGLAPQDLRLQYGKYRKPALAQDCGGNWLRFNLAHAHELVIYGVTCRRDIGVDVERVRTDLEHVQLAENFFAPVEVAVLKSVVGEQRVKAFFNGWTRKEAYIKAQGIGLAVPLDEFEVSLLPGAPVSLLKAVDHQETSQWSLCAIDAEPGYIAALAVKGTIAALSCWVWSGQPPGNGNVNL